jgi:hypothetical protein
MSEHRIPTRFKLTVAPKLVRFLRKYKRRYDWSVLDDATKKLLKCFRLDPESQERKEMNG